VAKAEFHEFTMTPERRVWKSLSALGLAAVLAWGAPAAGQILGGGLPVGIPSGLPSGLPAGLGGVPRTVLPARPVPPSALAEPASQVAGAADQLVSGALNDVRRLTVERLLREHSGLVEADDHGQPVVRGEALAIDVDRDTLDRLRRAGFTVRAQVGLRSLGLKTAVLGLPKGLSAVEAIRRLRELDPAGQYDFDHLYQAAGAVDETPGATRTAGGTAGADGRGLKVGMVDGSAAASRPALSGVRLIQRAFAPGGARVTAHATAVASLISGAAGRFHGAAPGATLLVADVYGPTPAGGSAQAIATALDWLAQDKAPVVNISLVGPPNLLLGASVRALIAKGVLVVAPVGNDGPAAPPLYPAAYPGVVAVTGVDAARHVLPEAGRSGHVDFSAPGADMAAAGVTGGLVAVRGTSFAAPVVAGRLAILQARSGSAAALDILARQAVDLGVPGPDPIYGRGLVGEDVRTDPARIARRR